MHMPPTFIDVMRHGEPEGACPQGGTILRGSIDHALTQKGWRQAQQRIADSSADWDVVVSSPLIRCADFAAQLVADYDKSAVTKTQLSKQQAVHKKTPLLFIRDAWREIHYGDWEGKSTQAIWQETPELMEKMWQAPLEFCAPNGESVVDFGQRIAHAWDELLADFQGKRVLLICHGGGMRLLLQQLLLLSPQGMNRFAIPYAAMSRYRIDHSPVSDAANKAKLQHWPSLIAHSGDEYSGEDCSGEDSSGKAL